MPETRTKPDQFQLRFPDGMRAELKEAAKENGRSLNSEILARLAVLDTVGLRDRFAGHALTGILAGGFADTIPHDDVGGGRDAALFAYQYADAMLAAREAR